MPGVHDAAFGTLPQVAPMLPAEGAQLAPVQHRLGRGGLCVVHVRLAAHPPAESQRQPWVPTMQVEGTPAARPPPMFPLPLLDPPPLAPSLPNVRPPLPSDPSPPTPPSVLNTDAPDPVDPQPPAVATATNTVEIIRHDEKCRTAPRGERLSGFKAAAVLWACQCEPLAHFGLDRVD
jgi:hypothetical protein